MTTERFKMKRVGNRRFQRRPLTEEQKAERRLKYLERKERRRQLAEQERARYKLCPFCGSLNVEYQAIGMQSDFVRCLDCNGTGPIANGKLQAIERWNKRVGETIEQMQG